MKITRFLDYGSSYSAETNPRRESIPNADNLNKGFCYRSYSFKREGLNGLNFDLQLSESGNVERERKRWSIDACLYFYHITFSLVFFFYHLVFLSFLFPLYSFLPLLLALLFFFPPPPPTIHGYPLLYCLPLWNLPLLSLNHFWLLVGISLGLPTNLLVV